MDKRAKVTFGAAMVALALIALSALALALFALTSRPTFAQTPSPSGHFTHERMHQMMDAMHGEGTSQRMHEVMGPQSEETMEQCVAMMNMMANMKGTMGGMSGMMGQPMSGMTPNIMRP